MGRLLPLLLIPLALLLSTLLASGWETLVKEKPQWHSLYLTSGVSPNPDTNSGFVHNEHAELVDLALRRVGAAQAYSRASGGSLRVVDLNASLFRPGLLGKEPFMPEPTLALEERLLPPPPHFGGIPDFSYTMFDWINKNALCPSLPDGAPNPERCHDFKGWLGAGFNASHFGTQASNMYLHLHKLALDLAKRARKLREILSTSDRPKDLEAWREYVEEAELEAMAYESYAQHFLHDRWSIGHMWERWNAGDYPNVAYPDSLWTNFEIGAAAGLLHGSESVMQMASDMAMASTGRTLRQQLVPDAMSSPHATKIRDRYEIEVPSFRHVGKVAGVYTEAQEAPFPGVGDHRLADMFDGEFGGRYNLGQQHLAVPGQREQMMACLAAGFGELIRAFGGDGGGYGIHGIRIPGTVKTFYQLDIGCFDTWATNRAMRLGWLEDNLARIGQYGRIVLAMAEDLAEKLGKRRTLKTHRADWVRISARVALEAKRAPLDTNLAQRDIGTFGKAKTGDQYPELPDYVEPASLDDLPEKGDWRGRDKQALFGFFNRSHTDYWCPKIPNMLEELRGSDEPVKAQACRYLADRLYAGTDPAYKGEDAEHRTLDGKANSAPVNPICWHFGQRGGDGGHVDDDNPVYLHPGYLNEAYARSKDGLTYASVANWCDKLPVMDLVPDTPIKAARALAAVTGKKAPPDYIAARVDDVEAVVEIRGHNFGAEPGRLDIGCAFDPIPVTDIESWWERRIRFRLPKHEAIKKGDHALCLTTQDGRKSLPFRHTLRIEAPRPKIRTLEVANGPNLYVRWPRGGQRAIPPGRSELTLTFAEEMDPREPAYVWLIIRRGDGFKRAREILLRGEWWDARTWRGTLDVPDDENFEELFEGERTLSIQARTALGMFFDGDPEKEGDQPNTEHRLRFARGSVTTPAPPGLAGCWIVAGPSGIGISRLEVMPNLRQGQISAKAKVFTPFREEHQYSELDFTGSYDPADKRLRLEHRYSADTLAYFFPYRDDPDYERLLAAGAKYVLNAEIKEWGWGYLAKSSWPYLSLHESNGLTTGPAKAKTRRLYRFNPTYTELQVTGPDYRTPLKEIKSGKPFWVVARSRESCPSARDRIPLVYTPDPMAGAIFTTISIVLQETDNQSREFRSPAEGIKVVEGIPVPGRFNTQLQPGLGMTMSSNAEEPLTAPAPLTIPFVSGTTAGSH